MQFNRFFIKILGIFCIFVCASSCNNAGELPKDNTGKEDFMAFYEKFHTDTLFQFKRIEFPLGGLNSEGQPTTWTEENWKWLKKIDLPEDQYKIIHQSSDNFVKERVIIQNAFIIERNFSYDEKTGKWLLTYFADVHFPQNTNRLSSNTEENQSNTTIDSVSSDHPDIE